MADILEKVMSHKKAASVATGRDSKPQAGDTELLGMSCLFACWSM